MSHQHEYTITVVGNKGVGKTSIVERFIWDIFQNEHKYRPGPQFAVKSISVSNGESVRLKVLDLLALSPRYNREMTYNIASCVIIVYDITQEQSFKSVQYWINDAFEFTFIRVPVALVGNKFDLAAERTVKSNRGAALAESISEELDVPTLFFETSVLTRHNIHFLFRELSETIFNYKEKPDLDEYFRRTYNTRVIANNWQKTKANLACHDKKYVLRFLGFPEVSGLQVSTEKIISILPEQGNIYDIIDTLREFLMTRLEQQVKGGGPTFGLDIEQLRKTDAVRFVNDIVNLRINEIRSLATQVNLGSEITPWALWNTYYGRMLIKSTNSPQNLDIQKTRHLLIQLEDAGIPVGLER